MNKFILGFTIVAALAGCGVKQRANELPAQATPAPVGALPDGYVPTAQSKFIVHAPIESVKAAVDTKVVMRIANRDRTAPPAVTLKVTSRMPSMPHMGISEAPVKPLADGNFEVLFSADAIPHGGVYEILIRVLGTDGAPLDELKLSPRITDGA